ncbi:MAG: hypothetical protein ACKOC5_01765, partial [Chloroflexota bacterium]
MMARFFNRWYLIGMLAALGVGLLGLFLLRRTAPEAPVPTAAADPSLAAACREAFTSISLVQGRGEQAALEGQTVTVQGVVIGDYEGKAPALRGFFLQDLQGDGDPDTSDGLFVFNADQDQVSLGQVVRVSGTVKEQNGQTQLSSPAGLVLCGTGSVAPVDVMLPLPAADTLERYEGMLVRLPQALVVSDVYYLGRFGQVTLSSGARLAQP